MIAQKTIKQAVSISGVGLHSGKPVTMTLRPGKAGSGIIFKRVDLLPEYSFKASANDVSETHLCTVIEREGCKIATVEHILSALSGLGIDNIAIEVDAPEIPIVDGSAAPFVYLLQKAGIVSQDAVKHFLVIKEEVLVREGDKWAKLSPFARGFKVDFRIDFKHPAIQKTETRSSLLLSPQTYIQEVARARTFGFLRDIEYLRQHNLALGGSLDNAVVLDEFRVLNDKGLRFENEFVRHKTLDAIGDLYLEGLAIIGHYQGYKSGHALNNRLYRALLADAENYEIRACEAEELWAEAPIGSLEANQTGLLF